MPIALEEHFMPAAAAPRPLPDTCREQSRAEIAVLFTSDESTRAALLHAGALAHGMAARITLLVLQIVPYPLPLTSPPVLIDWNQRRFRVIAATSRVETTVRLYLCRDRDDGLRIVLSKPSFIVLGGPKKWWRFTAERRLAGKLRRAGHRVVFIETE